MKKAFYIAIIYLAFGFLWIVSTDALLYDTYNNLEELQRISNLKGYAFVLISAIFFFLAILAFYKDVLKRKNQTDILFSNLDIGLIQISRTGHILDVHSNVCKKLGYTKKELLGRKSDDITHPEDFKEDRLLWELFLQDHSSYYNREKRYLHKNGTPIWFKLVGTMVKDYKGTPYFIAVLNDIDKIKSTEGNYLRHIKEKEVLINSTEDMMWSVDRDMRLKTFNESYSSTVEKWMNAKPRTGDQVLEKYTDNKVKHIWLNGYLRAWNNEHFSIINSQMIDSEMYYFKTSFNPVEIDSTVTSVVCFSKDITEEQNRIEALQRLVSDKEKN